MNLTNFTEIIGAGMNDPNCQFFVGSFLGQFVGLKLVFWIAIFMILVRALEKLAIEPFLSWLKKKIYKKRDHRADR